MSKYQKVERSLVWSCSFSAAVKLINPVNRLLSLCSLVIFDLKSVASLLNFSANCSNEINFSRHKSDSVIRKFSRLERRPILVSRSSRASTKAVARLRIELWICCSAPLRRGGRLKLPKEEMRLKNEGFLTCPEVDWERGLKKMWRKISPYLVRLNRRLE